MTGDTVYEQTQNWYDQDSNVVATANYQRFPTDNSSTGALTASNSYVTASVDWYDAAGRPTYQVNYGREDTGSGVAHYIFDTNGNLIAATDGNPLVSEQMPPSPNSSNNYIVSETVYNPRASQPGRSSIPSTTSASSAKRSPTSMAGPCARSTITLPRAWTRTATRWRPTRLKT